MLKILECANVWFLRFPDFKVENCIEFAVNSQLLTIGNLRLRNERALSIPLLMANSLHSLQKLTLK